MIQTDQTSPLRSTSTDIRFANTDGTFTDIIGTGFAQSGSQLLGTVTSVEASQGDVLQTVDLGLATSLSDLAAALGGEQASRQFYDLAAQGNTSLTAYQAAVQITPIFYYFLDDTPGNHHFVGQLSSGTGVSFAGTTSGVTVNLGTGTASWGGYNERYQYLKRHRFEIRRHDHRRQ